MQGVRPRQAACGGIGRAEIEVSEHLFLTRTTNIRSYLETYNIEHNALNHLDILAEIPPF